jgi:hypothetical protein
MRYRVHGISRTTGKETTLLVNAKHHEAAHAIGSRQLFVSDVLPEGGLPEPEVFDRRALDPAPIESTPHSPPAPRERRPRLPLILIFLALLATLFLIIFLNHRT